MTTLSFLSNNALLKTTIEAVFQENDVSTVTPRIIFTALAARFDCPLESITEDAAAKSRIKELARDIALSISAAPAPPKAGATNKCIEKPKKSKKSMAPDVAKTDSEETSSSKVDSKKRHRATPEAVSKKRRQTANPDNQLLQLRKLVADLMLGPTLYRGLPEDPELYAEALQKRIISKCQQLAIIPRSAERLPSQSECQVYRRQRQRSQELDGLDPNNIILNSSRHSRHAKRPAQQELNGKNQPDALQTKKTSATSVAIVTAGDASESVALSSSELTTDGTETERKSKRLKEDEQSGDGNNEDEEGAGDDNLKAGGVTSEATGDDSSSDKGDKEDEEDDEDDEDDEEDDEEGEKD